MSEFQETNSEDGSHTPLGGLGDRGPRGTFFDGFGVGWSALNQAQVR